MEQQQDISAAKQDIPKFLQTNGRVRNNHLPKGQCEDLVNQCWEMKAEHDESEGKKTQLGDFFPIFIESKSDVHPHTSDVHPHTFCWVIF